MTSPFEELEVSSVGFLFVTFHFVCRIDVNKLLLPWPSAELECDVVVYENIQSTCGPFYTGYA